MPEPFDWQLACFQRSSEKLLRDRFPDFVRGIAEGKPQSALSFSASPAASEEKAWCFVGWICRKAKWEFWWIKCSLHRARVDWPFNLGEGPGSSSKTWECWQLGLVWLEKGVGWPVTPAVSLGVSVHEEPLWVLLASACSSSILMAPCALKVRIT